MPFHWIRAGRGSTIALCFLLGFSFLSVATPFASAHGTVDQQCTGVAVGYLDGIGNHEPAGQTFKPSQTSLVGFDIYIRSSNGVPTPMTARILQGGIGGPSIGSVDFSVPTAFGGTGAWFHVDFTAGVSVTPGSTYFLDLDDKLSSAGIKWFLCVDAYADGGGYESGALIMGGADLTFKTYAGDFSVSAIPSALTITQGSFGTITARVSSVNGFSSPVALTIVGPVPPAASLTVGFGTNPVTPPAGGSADSIVTLTVGGGGTPGAYSITLRGTSGPLTHDTTISLTIVSSGPSPDFSMGSTPAALSVNQGSSATAQVSVTSLNGFSSAVGLSYSWVGSAPADGTVSLPPSVTPPPGGTANAPLMVSAGALATLGVFTVRVTGTSGSLIHSVDVSLQITAAATTSATTSTLTTGPGPDFSIFASPSTLSVSQGASSTSTVTIGSVNGFSSAVGLTYSWFGTAPSGVSVALPSPVTPPSGGSANSMLAVTASAAATLGSYTLSVTGTSGSLTHSVSVAVTITAGGATQTTTTGGGRCLIATAAYGSEVAPEVQFLRNFRDNSLMKTKAGSAFMIAFNAWYYSFSPSAAAYLNHHALGRTGMRIILYPALGILKLSSAAFSTTSANPELAALISGLTASSLIGAVYLGFPLALLRTSIHRAKRFRDYSAQVTLLLALVASVGAFTLAEILSNTILLVLSSSLIVLSTLFLSAVFTSAKISGKLRSFRKLRYNKS